MSANISSYKEVPTSNTYAIMLAIVCFVTNLSQLTIFANNSNSSKIAISVWIIFSIILTIKGKVYIQSKLIPLLFVMILFYFAQVVLTILSENSYLTSVHIYPLGISLFVFFIGSFVADKVDEKGIYIIALAYVFSTLIVAIDIYIYYYQGKINWSISRYVYESKNSVSQNLFTGLAILLVLTKNTNLIAIVRWTSIVFLFVMIFLLQSRATIAEIVVLLCVVILLSKNNKRLKVLSVMFIIAFFIFINISNAGYDIIVNKFLLTGRSINDLNDVSSGRLEIVKSFPSLINGNYLVGLGERYFENFHLAAILQHGILFGWIIIGYALWPMIWGVKTLRKDEPINILFIVIACSYNFNGLFEGVAPLGPGIKCYFLWLLFGMLYVKKEKIIMKAS